MATREEIREGIAKILHVIHEVDLSKRGLPTLDITEDLKIDSFHPSANAIMQYLHSQGVVFKVERELPFVTSSFTVSEHGVYAKISEASLNEQGYVAVEPLIEDGSPE